MLVYGEYHDFLVRMFSIAEYFTVENSKFVIFVMSQPLNSDVTACNKNEFCFFFF